MLFVRVIITVIILDGRFFFLFLNEDDVYIRVDFWEGEWYPLVVSFKLHFFCYTTKAEIPGLRGIIILEFSSFFLLIIARPLVIAFASSQSIFSLYLPTLIVYLK